MKRKKNIWEGLIIGNFIFLVIVPILTILGKPEELITYVEDRKGHDRRYAIDPSKIHRELGWLPETSFAEGIKKTINWYLNHQEWWRPIVEKEMKIKC